MISEKMLKINDKYTYHIKQDKFDQNANETNMKLQLGNVVQCSITIKDGLFYAFLMTSVVLSYEIFLLPLKQEPWLKALIHEGTLLSFQKYFPDVT